ncbi:MAG: CobW family GTP-binding protein [Rhodocyclaceae bacterium]
MSLPGFMRAEHDDRRVPVVVLTGFLGAGKTTLLNHLLQRPDMARSAVLINEFGEVGVDHHLVEKVDETLVLLDSGCICCSVQGDLVRALKRLFQQAARREIPVFERVLIETTGLADPAPVVFTLMEDPFIADRYRCDGVITAVDTTHAHLQLDTQREALKQVAMADRLLLTKCDLATPEQIATVAERVAQINPGAERIEVRGGIAPEGAFAGCGLYDPAGKMPDVATWLGEERDRKAAAGARATTGPDAWRRPGARPLPEAGPPRHDDRVASHVLVFDEPLDWLGFADGLGLLLQVYGDKLLRVKGLLNVAGDPQPRVVQCVQHVAYPPASLDAWPAAPPYDDRRSRLVFIVRDLPRAEIENILGSFLGQPPAATA